MRQVRKVALNPFAQVSLAGVAGYLLPKLFGAIMQSRASDPVAFTFAVVAATSAVWHLYGRPSSINRTVVPVAVADESAAAPRTIVDQADLGVPNEITADQREAAQRIAKWVRQKQKMAAMRNLKGIGTSPDVGPVAVAAVETVAGDEPVSSGATAATSPVVAALVDSGVFDAASVQQSVDAANEGEVAQPTSDGSHSPSLKR